MRPWTPASAPPPIGLQVELRFRDPLGQFDLPGPFFLHDDGRWYKIDPPALVKAAPTHWRPAAAPAAEHAHAPARRLASLA